MRILFITATYSPSANGVAISLRNLKESLINEGHEVLVLAPEYRGINKESGVVYYPSADNLVLPDYPIPLFITTKEVMTKVKLFKPDIIHVHHPFHVGYFAKVIAKRLSIPIVFTYHTKYDFYAEKYFAFLPKDLKSKFLVNSITSFCNSVNLIVSPSNFIAKELKTKGVITKSVIVPSVPTDLVLSSNSKSFLRKKHNIPVDKTILLTVSRLSVEKNIELIIKSIKYLPEKFMLLVCGDGPIKNKLELLSKKLKIANRIIFTGKLDRKLISEYYSLSDYFVYTSFSETQGIIFLEALTFGLPVISTKSEAAIEWIKNEYGELVDAKPQSLSNSIINISKRNYLKMSNSAKKYATGFTPKMAVSKLIAEYSDTIGKYGISNEILETGWQSWSVSKDRGVLSLKRDYNPLLGEYVPTDINDQNVIKDNITGWCSWYAFGREINHQKITDQARWFSKNKDEAPIQYILIDEGWAKWGSWNIADKQKFPKGMRNVSNEIHKLGLKSGIWISPFLVEKDSFVYKEHRDWLVINNGKLVNGINWTVFDDLYLKRYILDFRNEKVKKYIFETIDMLVKEYKFDLIKFDFLYAIYFIPDINQNEAGDFIRSVFKYVREKYKNVYTIACGSPLMPVVGVADAVRIGPDTISPYLDKVPIISRLFHTLRIRDVVSNISKRKFTSKYWNIDPDVFVCRDSIGVDEKIIDLLFQNIKSIKTDIFLGDDMTSLSNEKIQKYISPILK